VLHALLISSSLTWSLQLCLGRNTIYEVPNYGASCNVPSLHLFSVQIFLSVPCSRTSSVCVPPSILENKFRTHTEPQAKL
jgi:hypothetical protein